MYVVSMHVRESVERFVLVLTHLLTHSLDPTRIRKFNQWYGMVWYPITAQHRTSKQKTQAKNIKKPKPQSKL